MTDDLNFGALRSPRHILFGAGQRFALARHVARLGQRVLIVTDQRMAASDDFLQLADSVRVLAPALAVYDGVEAELPAECLAAGLDAAKRHGADVIVGLGGGSCIDAAKIVALQLAHGGTPADYYGEHKIPGPVTPLIAVPTTAGTGSEATPVAVISDPERAVKVGIASPWLIPETAICDPELTLTCPPGLTAVSGADALVHAIEAYTTARRQPDAEITHDHVFVGKTALTDPYALAAIENIVGSLAEAVENGKNLAARSAVMLGALQAGLAFGTAGTSVCHAVQYPVGALTHTAHGLGVALMLPYALEFNRAFAGAEIAAIGRLMGVSETDEMAQIDATIAAVAALFERIRIPKSLAEIGVAEDKLDWIAEQALNANRLIKNNPRPVDRAGMDALVAATFAGDRTRLAERN
jgi:alcohol dehydrogenase class IV